MKKLEKNILWLIADVFKAIGELRKQVIDLQARVAILEVDRHQHTTDRAGWEEMYKAMRQGTDE